MKFHQLGRLAIEFISSKELIILLIFILFMEFEYLLMIHTFFNLNFKEANIFLTEILGLQVKVSRYVIILSSVIDIFLIYKLGQLLYSKNVGLISAFLFSTSPWVIFLSFHSENSIFLMTIILLQLIGFIKRETSLGKKLFIISSLALFASSLLLWPWVLGFVWYFYKKTKQTSRILIIIPLIIILCLFHLGAVQKNLANEVTMSKEIGLLNAVNRFQGEMRDTKLSILGKLVENKYLYFSEHFLFNVLSTLSPVTYFSPQSKILNFAFTPPLFIALLIPFGIFFIGILKRIEYFKIGLILLLVIPATLVQNAPDLAKLVLLAPFLILTTGAGLEKLLQNKSKLGRILLFFIILLFIFQSVVTVSDISIRERTRLIGTFGPEQ